MQRSHRINRRQAVAGLAAAAVASSGAGRAVAQGGPTIRIIFPFAAGGAADATVRLLADRMQASLHQTVIVENRTGAAGRIGVNAVKNASPDGTTLLFTTIAPMAIYPSAYKSLDYDPFNDFAALSQIATYDFGIAVGPGTPAKTSGELVAWLKAHPEKAQFGSPAAGTLPHFFGLMFGRAIGVEMTHIAYKGTPPALGDLLGGQIPMASTTAAEFVELHNAGKIRVIGTSDIARSPSLPDVPTFKESGFDLVGAGWYGMFVPKGMPPDLVARLNRAIVAAVAEPEVKARLIGFGLRPTGTSAAELGAIQKADAEKWGAIVKASGFTAD